jgi:hypothetical protein
MFKIKLLFNEFKKGFYFPAGFVKVGNFRRGQEINIG